jgi:hypothetical protein
MVSTDVAATASSAQDAHHGHESFFVSCAFGMPLNALPQSSGSVEPGRTTTTDPAEI